MLQEHSAILSTFIKLPIVIKTFVLVYFERPFYTGFTVCVMSISISQICPEQMSIGSYHLNILNRLYGYMRIKALIPPLPTLA